MASSSSSAGAVINKHDVFLSFRGEDTRSNFTSHLNGLLHKEGIEVFMDDDLRRGDDIKPSLLKAIQQSKISVIIFSKTYSSSRWCLEELVKILECRKRFEQSVIPVFYHVDPTHVRNQTGFFGNEFAKLIKYYGEQSERWRNALREAADISGFTSSDYHRNEYGLLHETVKEILKILNHMSASDDEKRLVGIQPMIEDIESLLGNEPRMVGIVGIWGMGGIGKTTVANFIFNKNRSQFEASYFAQNVREEAMSPSGLTSLKEKLLSTILKDQNSNIDFKFTKGRIGRKRIFIGFDDVTSLNQIEFLIGDLNCLGPGSRVIITTRNRQVLKNCGVGDNMIYKMEGLFPPEALQLFSWFAFQRHRPDIDYKELSNRVVKYANGVPLALKVLGCYLYGKEKQVWESAIRKLEIIPHGDIQKVLKVSYDGLDDVDKDIFLDIACFLKRENKDFVENFLNACGFFAENGISVLIDHCLIIIFDNKITMHDLLQEMGWEIVRQESIKDPGKRSRLWYHEDIYHVFEENIGTKAIEGICLDMSKKGEVIDLEPSALAIMHQLRFFKLHNSQYEENNINKVNVSLGLDFISSQLRYLCWHGCPLKSLQSNFHRPNNLIALDMPHSNIEQLWSGIQLVNLKHINLSYSKHLSEIQDMSSIPNLVTLILEGCTSLFKISSSIGCLKKLSILNVSQCKSLHCLLEVSCNIKELLLDETAINVFPSSTENLSKLVILSLENCSMMEILPESICKMESLEYLNLSRCSKLDGLPDNLGNLKALQVLKAEKVAINEVPSSIIQLSSLIELNMTNCHIRELPNDLFELLSLERLLLSGNNFDRIPIGIQFLRKLSYLDISYCERLQSIPPLPLCLKYLDANSCTLLVKTSHLSPKCSICNFSNCFKLDQVKLERAVKFAFRMGMITYYYSFRHPRPATSVCMCFPGNEIPEWFTCQNESCSVILELQTSDWTNPKFLCFAMCAIIEFQDYHNEGQGLVVCCDCVLESTNDRVAIHYDTFRGWAKATGPLHVEADHIFIGYDNCSNSIILQDDHYNWMSAQFYIEDLNSKRIYCCNVKKCGIHLLSRSRQGGRER